MNSIKNQVTIIGNLQKPAEITTFENGSIVARFSIAIDRTRKQAKDKQAKTQDWYRLFAWGNRAEFIHQYCKTGSHLAITGRLVNRTYLSKDGKLQKITEVEVQHIVRLTEPTKA